PVEGAAAIRHVRLAKAWQIGSDDMEAILQQRDEIAEHVARARKPMKQQELRSVRRTGLSIEDAKAVHVDGAIRDGGHGASPPEDFRLSRLHRRGTRPCQSTTVAVFALCRAMS